jgi:hypothetical protein
VESGQNPWRPLGQMLVESGLINLQQLEVALHEQARSREPIGRILVSLGYISAQTLRSALLRQWGLDRARQEGFGSGLLRELERRGVGLRSVAEPRPREPAATTQAEPMADPVTLAPARESGRPPLEALLDAFEERSRALSAELAAMRRLLDEIAS